MLVYKEMVVQVKILDDGWFMLNWKWKFKMEVVVCVLWLMGLVGGC